MQVSLAEHSYEWVIPLDHPRLAEVIVWARLLQRLIPEWPEYLRCTGLTAAWCPVHGDCTCPERDHGDMEDPSCPLHNRQSMHAGA